MFTPNKEYINLLQAISYADGKGVTRGCLIYKKMREQATAMERGMAVEDIIANNREAFSRAPKIKKENQTLIIA